MFRLFKSNNKKMKERRKAWKLIKELKHQGWKIRSVAAEALAMIGAQAVEPLIQAVKDPLDGICCLNI